MVGHIPVLPTRVERQGRGLHVTIILSEGHMKIVSKPMMKTRVTSKAESRRKKSVACNGGGVL